MTDNELDSIDMDAKAIANQNPIGTPFAWRKAYLAAFARAVLAKWGQPTPPAVVEPLTADGMREPKNGQQWRVEWWNESCRMMLPKDSRLDSFQSHKNGTLMFTIKKGGSNA